METARIALAPRRDLVVVPSSEIILWSRARWSAASRLATDLAISLLALATALRTPLPRYLDLSPSRSSRASCSPVEAPEGTAARPSAPPSRTTSASTVGLPRESMIWRAWTLTMFVDMTACSTRTCESIILQKNAAESQENGEKNPFVRNLEGQFASSGFRLFDKGFLANDDDNAGIGDVKAAAVGFEVVANLGAFRKADVAVDDGAANARVAADVHVVVDDGLRDFRVAVDTHIVADDGSLHAAAGDHRAAGDDGIEGHTHALGVGEDEFCGRILMLPGAQRPGAVVQVEDRRHADQIHVGFVVGVDGAHVAPIQSILAVFVDEVVGEDAVLRNDARKDVFAEIVMRLGILGIGKKDGDHQLRVENVDAHGGVAMSGVVRRLFRRGGLFLEADDAPIFIDFDHAELLGGLFHRNLDNADGHIGAGVYMLLEHLGVIHLIDVIAGENENEFGALAADGINVLIYGVGGTLIPLLGDAHLRRKDFDVIAEAGERRPTGANVPVQAERLVLSEDEYAAEIRIDAIGESDVNNAIKSAERHGG